MTVSKMGLAHDGPFHPAQLGITPRATSSACWNGYLCEYVIIGGGLALTRLHLSVEGEPPLIDGVAPVRDEAGSECQWLYTGPTRAVPFTGRLIVGAELARDARYLHMGYWPAWFYQEVHEFSFAAGKLTGAVDRSAPATGYRRRHRTGEVQPARGRSDNDWIQQTFSRRPTTACRRSSGRPRSPGLRRAAVPRDNGGDARTDRAYPAQPLP